MGRSPFAQAHEAFGKAREPAARAATLPVTFTEATLVRIDRGDLERVDVLAERLRLPAAAVVALLVRAGLEAVKQDPALLLGGNSASA